MTEIITRKPLEALGMASTQRNTRRRMSGIADADEDAPPAKKAKVEDSSKLTTRQANGRKAAATNAAEFGSYSEDRDGFSFSRRRKAPKQKPATVENESEQSVRPGRRKKSSNASSALPPEPETRRRSARLSGESVDSGNSSSQQQADELTNGLTKRTASPKRREKQPRRRETSHPAPAEKSGPTQKTPETKSKIPQDSNGGLHVEKKRETTKIALPFADTPVITRNKEMRKSSAETRRRSSSGMRGRRASSLIDSGVSNAVPHNEVVVSDFYKHISQDLPEPRRMKQLLTWCGARALLQKPSKETGDVNAILAARAIEEELLKDFTNKSEMCDWFSRDEDVSPAVLVKRPNPRNQHNAKKLQELELEAKRLEHEKSTWDKLLSSLSISLDHSPPPKRPEDDKADTTTSHTDLDPTLLADHDQLEYHKTLTSQDSIEQNTKSRLKEASQSLEFKIDTFADGVHKLSKLDEVVDQTVSGVLEESANSLKAREEKSTSAAAGEGKAGGGVREILRAFSRATAGDGGSNG